MGLIGHAGRSPSCATTEHSNFLKGVKWSPRGDYLLTAADDACLRLYECPDFGSLPQYLDDAEDTAAPLLRVPAGELIYDYAWYPWATVSDPVTFCFVVAARSHPLHLYDAATGELRCSYRPYNRMDELSPGYSIAFSPDGSLLYVGTRDSIEIFQLDRPGRDHDSLITRRRQEDGQPGIISCIAFASIGVPHTFAAGSYSGVAALYDARTREQLAVLEGHVGGVTHLRFSACGNYLYTGGRRDENMYCWDARYVSGAVYAMRRATKTTNQRIFFDVEPCGRHLGTGGEDGCVRLYDLRDGSEAGRYEVARDTVNGCQFHPNLPFLATASGHRRYSLAPLSDSDDDLNDSSDSLENDQKKGTDSRDAFKLTREENYLGVFQLKTRQISSAPDQVMAEI